MLRGNKYPIIASASAVLFCLMNGFIQGRYLTNYIEYDVSWFYDPRFLVGHVIFLLGLAINIHSDAILRGLRKPGEKGYKIPYGESSRLSVRSKESHFTSTITLYRCN